MSGPGVGNQGHGKSVPAQDSAENYSVADVVGNKTDTHDGNSLYALAETNEEHNHAAGKVYPTLADGVVLTAVTDASTWTLGSLVEVVPADTITEDFDIHYISIEGLSANTVYEIVLYAGAGDTEIGRCRVTREAVGGGTRNVPIQTPIVAANSRIRAAVATAGNNGETATISLKYHTY